MNTFGEVGPGEVWQGEARRSVETSGVAWLARCLTGWLGAARLGNARLAGIGTAWCDHARTGGDRLGAAGADWLRQVRLNMARCVRADWGAVRLVSRGDVCLGGSWLVGDRQGAAGMVRQRLVVGGAVWHGWQRMTRPGGVRHGDVRQGMAGKAGSKKPRRRNRLGPISEARPLRLNTTTE